ncbi:MAG TPA: SDR family oxidoreductase [Bryobacteraceae bacterium]|nr:SDR family oxidoreductase [Bryobacteraceae bacterium]
MTGAVRGPVVLVTGASSGIGQCCASLLARKGYRVYGASRSAGSTSDGVAPLHMDVTLDDSVRAGCASVLEREGRLDVLINSAGMGIAGALEDTSPDEAREQFEVNLFGVLRVCRSVLPIMRQQGSGYIVNIGSIGGLVAIPYQGLYSASKFALEGLTECLRMEVKGFGIHVVLIEPGDHRTGFTKNRRSTAASSENPAYGAAFARAIERMARDEQTGPPPDNVARVVYKVIRTRNPRLRYTAGTGAQRAAVWLKRLAPNALVEKIIMAYYAR